jgi:hypothetical protein
MKRGAAGGGGGVRTCTTLGGASFCATGFGESLRSVSEIGGNAGTGCGGFTATGVVIVAGGAAAGAAAADFAMPWAGSTNEAVASMSESASPRATIAVTKPTKIPIATSAAAHETVGRPMRTRVRVVTTVAGGSLRDSGGGIGVATGT